MKKLLSIIATLLIATALYAQKEVTKFLGIPVDGTKANMIQQLKAKGYQYNSSSDILTGEFNGRDVHISVVTNNNKVYRIMVMDADGSNETDIRIRFNRLCQQFEDNEKYIAASDMDYKISEDEDISYEMVAHNKRYEADFYQKVADLTTDTLGIQEYATKFFLSQYTTEQLVDISEEDKTSAILEATMRFVLERMEKRSVWFMIDEKYGKYYILLYYDNRYNQANGEDL